MKIMVTGGLGFIGSNFIRMILSKYKDYHIINIDKMTYAGNPANLKDVEANKNYTFVKGDICNTELVSKLAKDCDAIINFAAETHVDRSILDPYGFVRTDVEGTFNLLEASRKHDIKKYIQISTDETYGSVEKGSSKETDMLDPSSPYSASKTSADLLTMSYFKTYGLPILITRSSNNFGPYQYPEKLMPLFITNLIEGKKVPVYGDGLNVRDWLYVGDNCDGIGFVLHNGKLGEIYNIGGDNEKTNMEITKIILKQLGKDENSIEYIKDRPGHDRRYSLDSAKIKNLGWKPQHNFTEAMKKTIEWYKKNQEWWKHLKSGEYLKYYKRVYHDGFKEVLK